MRLPAASECVLSTIIVAELEVGVRRSVRPAAQRKAVDAFTELFEVLPWDLQAASYYGDLRVDLEKRGIVIGPLDMLIAAHALRLGATLVTANFREFRRVADLREGVTGVRAAAVTRIDWHLAPASLALRHQRKLATPGTARGESYKVVEGVPPTLLLLLRRRQHRQS